MIYRTYIGNSVYAEIEVVSELKLTTKDGDGPSNTIILTSGAFEVLQTFIKHVNKKTGFDE